MQRLEFYPSPEKRNPITRKAKWCGRIITADGITLDPRRIDGLLSMQRPETAGDLQLFICAINWMRKGIPEYNKKVGPLQTLLLTLTKNHGSNKKALEKVQLGPDIWTPEVHNMFEEIKRLIADRVTLSHLDPDMRLCVNTEASDHYLAGALTQTPQEDASKPQAKQRHEPLAFVSGAFSDAMEDGRFVKRRLSPWSTPWRRRTITSHTTSAYHAQSNGTVEVVCRETIRACRALLSESKLGPKVWPKFTSIIQSVRNNSITDKLGKHCPYNSFHNAAANESIGGIISGGLAEYRGENPHSRKSRTANRV